MSFQELAHRYAATMPLGKYAARSAAQALDLLTLPFAPAQDDLGREAFASVVQARELEPADWPSWVMAEKDAWFTTGVPSRSLRNAIENSISATGYPGAEIAAKRYFETHAKLRTLEELDARDATAVLSEIPLIWSLAHDGKMSSAQIARVIGSRGVRYPVHWGIIQPVLAALGMKPTFSADEFTTLYLADTEAQEERFADADLPTAAASVCQLAESLGTTEEFSAGLVQLYARESHLFPVAQIQILHFQCCIASKYDHELAQAYEFSPRGEAVKTLIETYPDALVSADNPFLNIAKSTRSLDRDWARSKKAADQPDTFALVQVIEQLDSLGHAARTELASAIRELTVRLVNTYSKAPSELPDALSSVELRRLLASVAKSETQTRGVIEQRLVDLTAAFRHQEAGWISRGLSDPVNASNTSGKKLGDCEFQESGRPHVVAYEAHSGKLTSGYAELHLKTLEKGISRRNAEWIEVFDSSEEACVDLIFVSHTIESGLVERSFHLDGVEVNVSYFTYDSWFAGFDPSLDELAKTAEPYLLSPLRERRTPESVRQTLLGLI